MQNIKFVKRKFLYTASKALAAILLMSTAYCSCNGDPFRSGPFPTPESPSGSDVISGSTNQSGKSDETSPKLNALAGAAYVKPPAINNYGSVAYLNQLFDKKEVLHRKMRPFIIEKIIQFNNMPDDGQRATFVEKIEELKKKHCALLPLTKNYREAVLFNIFYLVFKKLFNS